MLMIGCLARTYRFLAIAALIGLFGCGSSGSGSGSGGTSGSGGASSGGSGGASSGGAGGAATGGGGGISSGGSAGSGGGASCSCASGEGCLRPTVTRSPDTTLQPWVVWPSEADGKGTLIVSVVDAGTVINRITVANADMLPASASYPVDL